MAGFGQIFRKLCFFLKKMHEGLAYSKTFLYLCVLFCEEGIFTSVRKHVNLSIYK